MRVFSFERRRGSKSDTSEFNKQTMRQLAFVWLSVLIVSCNLTDEAPGIRSIPYSLLVDLGSDIVIINKDLSQTRLSDGGFNSAPSWSPDGSKVAYWTGDGIVIVNEDSTGKRILSSLPDGWLSARPVWSPDGTLIAYDALQDQYGIGIIRVDGSDQRFFPTGLWNTNLVWSNDGSTLIFNRLQGSRRQIFSIGVDGTQEFLLTVDTLKTHSNPTVSPDGRYLTFWEYDAGVPTPRVVVRDLITRGELTISSHGFGVVWSKDSQWMYYDEKTDRGSMIYRIKPDGTSKQRLSTRLFNVSYDDFVQSISAYGEKIAFTSDRAGIQGIYIMNADGSDQQLLLEHVDPAHPRWRPR